MSVLSAKILWLAGAAAAISSFLDDAELSKAAKTEKRVMLTAWTAKDLQLRFFSPWKIANMWTIKNSCHAR